MVRHGPLIAPGIGCLAATFIAGALVYHAPTLMMVRLAKTAAVTNEPNDLTASVWQQPSG